MTSAVHNSMKALFSSLVFFAIHSLNSHLCLADIPVDVHNDLFLAAGLIGEALQSMVTTISRATGIVCI